MAFAYYAKARGVEMISIEQRWSRSDTIDVAYYRRSADNGRTWSAPVEKQTGERRAAGMMRRHLRGPWVDPVSGRTVEFWVEGVLPSDDPLEGMRQWNIYYTVDGGSKVHQVIQEGGEFDARHPLPGVYTGKNAVMLGDNTCVPLARKDGTVLLPVEISPLGDDGKLYNPAGGYTYTDAAVALGKWRGARLEWEMGQAVKGDPARSTRGMVEPTLAELADGRILMVMRGSNDKKPELPAYKWASWSRDGGLTWTEPAPWTYTDGEAFYSPSACSQLLKHSSGRLFWLGNIGKANPKGNRPRYPFQVGEVDAGNGLLKRSSIRVVDDRREGENEILTLSNFYAREDRRSREVVVHMTRLFALADGWEGDAMEYRIAV
jgi:hypothetical protein